MDANVVGLIIGVILVVIVVFLIFWGRGKENTRVKAASQTDTAPAAPPKPVAAAPEKPVIVAPEKLVVVAPEKPVVVAPEKPVVSSVSSSLEKPVVPAELEGQTIIEGAEPEVVGQFGSAPAAPQEPVTAAPAEPAAPAQPDDLTIIEGIGPKVASLLKQQGITGFAQLAVAEVPALEKILQENGLRFMKPASWPEQARLAAAGKMDELKALQDKLVAGR